MEEYPNISFGQYEGTPINEIPMEYLTWMFDKLYFRPSQRGLYKSILSYFLTIDIRVEGGKFFFNDYKFLNVEGEEKPFMISLVLKNSKGKNVYVVGNSNEPIFLEENNESIEIANGYAAIDYKYSGNKMMVEFNNDYYFKDNQGLFMIGAYLMRMPILPKGLDIEFSENLLTKDIKNELKNK